MYGSNLRIESGLTESIADRFTVTREDMQTLKNDWLTDNVGLIARNSPCWAT